MPDTVRTCGLCLRRARMLGGLPNPFFRIEIDQPHRNILSRSSACPRPSQSCSARTSVRDGPMAANSARRLVPDVTDDRGMVAVRQGAGRSTCATTGSGPVTLYQRGRSRTTATTNTVATSPAASDKTQQFNANLIGWINPSVSRRRAFLIASGSHEPGCVLGGVRGRGSVRRVRPLDLLRYRLGSRNCL